MMNKKLPLIGAIVATLALTGCGYKNSGEQDIIQIEDTDKDLVDDSKEENTAMTDDEMIDQSDYIAKVKMIEKGQGNLELKVLDNIKGNINADKIPNTELLEKHRTYLVFLKD